MLLLALVAAVQPAEAISNVSGLLYFDNRTRNPTYIYLLPRFEKTRNEDNSRLTLSLLTF